MVKQIKIPSQGQNSFTDVQSVALITGTLARHRRVSPNIAAHDSWANTDGDVDINDENGQLVGSFKVQAKTLAGTGKLKFACPVGFLEYCSKIQPVLLLVADNEAEKIYWMYLDSESTARLNYTANTTSKTIDLIEEQSFSKTDTAYIDAWTKIFLKKKNQVDALVERVRETLTSDIDVGKNFLETHRYNEGLKYLVDLKKRRWAEADAHSKYRILSNIAAAQCQLDQSEEGALNFLEAYDFQPDLPKAQVNKAMAHIIQGDYQEALDQANKVLKTNPLDTYATSAKVQAMTRLGEKLSEIEKSIDTATKKSPDVAHALSIAAKQDGLDAEFMNYLEMAAKDNEDPHINADLGITLLDSVMSSDRTAVKGMLSPAQTALVNNGITLLQKSWRALPDPDDRKHHSDWLFDISMGYRILGLECDAEKANEELTSLVPDNEVYAKNAIIIALESKNFAAAEVNVKQMLKKGSTLPDLPVILVDTLRYQKKNNEAMKLAKKFLADRGDKRDSLYVDMSENLFDILLEEGGLDQAQALANTLLEEQTTLMPGLLFSARLARIKQDSEDNLRYLEKAEEAITAQIYEKLILDLAEEAYAAGAYAIASRSYKRILQHPNADNPFTQRYLRSLYQTNRYDEAIEVAKSIRENSGSSRSVTQFEWGSYLELQDLPNARKTIDLYIREHPEDEEARLSRAIIDLRSNNLEELDAYLGSDIRFSELSLVSEIQLSNLYQSRNQPLRTLEIIYDVRRRYPNEADAHSAYVSIFLGLEDTKALSSIVDIKIVQPNSALRYEGGHFIVEDTYDPQISNNEISEADAKKRGFIGKKKGDIIVLSQNHLAKNEVRITEVQSKYVFALQDSMQNFERRFSDRKDLMGFNVDENNFDPLFKQLDQSAEQSESTEQLYKDGQLTIDLFAKLLGKNIIEVFYALMATPDLGVKVANGTVEESRQVQELLASVPDPEIVADITALISLHTLGVKLSEIGLGKLIVAQRTKDLIFTLISQHESFGKKKTMTLYKRNGQYIRQEITAKEQKQRLKMLKQLSEWVDENTVVEALTQSQQDSVELNSAAPDKLNDLIHEAQLDTIKLAVGDSRLFYTDDLGLRSISAGAFNTNGIWTQALLAHQCDIKKLSIEEYERTTIEQIVNNYHHVAISSQILMSAANRAKWLPQEPLTNVLKTVSRPEVSSTSMTVVLVNFLYDFYSQTTVGEKGLVVQAILNESTRHHDRVEVINLLKRGLQVRFKLNPIALRDIEDCIKAWLKPHSP